MRVLLESLRIIIARRELLLLMTWREVRTRYLRTSLGLLWVVLQPALLLLFYTFIFAVVFRVRLPMAGGQASRTDYMLFVLGGLLPWTAFADGTVRAGQSLSGHASVITKVAFPVELLPLSAVGAAFSGLIVSTTLVTAALAVLGKATLSLLLLPIVSCLLMMMSFGFGCLLAVLNAFVRDISHIQGYLFNLWMYATPVVYPSESVPTGFRWLLLVNPMVPLVECFRAALLGTHPVDSILLLQGAGYAIGIFFFGLFCFARAKRLYAELL